MKRSPERSLSCQPRISRKSAPALRGAGTRSSIKGGETRVGLRRPDLARPTVSSRPRMRRHPPESKRIRLTSTAPHLRPQAGLARARRREMRDGRDYRDRRPSDSPFAKAVGRQRLDWPTSRTALERILVDLETRSVDDPNVQRLRRLIALRDDAWKARHDRGRRHGRRRDRLNP